MRCSRTARMLLLLSAIDRRGEDPQVSVHFFHQVFHFFFKCFHLILDVMDAVVNSLVKDQVHHEHAQVEELAKVGREDVYMIARRRLFRLLQFLL